MSNLSVAPLLAAGFNKVENSGMYDIYRLGNVEVMALEHCYSVDFYNGKNSIGQLSLKTELELIGFLLSIREFSNALNAPELPAKHPVNGIIANALEALARQVRESDNDVTELGSIGVGDNLITNKLESDGLLYCDLIIDLTPPPPPPAQNVNHADDDDTDDGVKGVRQ